MTLPSLLIYLISAFIFVHRIISPNPTANLPAPQLANPPIPASIISYSQNPPATKSPAQEKPETSPLPKVLSQTTTTQPQNLIQDSDLNSAVNDYRASNNLNKLQIDPLICQTSLQRLSEISSNFTHDGFFQHLEVGDYNHLGYTQVAENLWQGHANATDIVNNWSSSGGHADNLRGDFTKGCGAYENQNAVFIFLK